MAVLKITKIRDQGMEWAVFMLRFKICIGGLDFKIRVTFLRF